MTYSFYRISLVPFLVLLLAACAKTKDDSDLSLNAENAAMEGGITSLSALIDDQAGSSFAATRAKTPAEKLFDLAIPTAYAASCQRAFDQTCNSGTKNFAASSCDLLRGAKFSGFVNLAYSNASCSMAAEGDSVTRTYDYDIAGPYGGVLAVTSEGGGGRLTRTATGWTAEILGKRKVLTFRGRERMNLSISTPQPIEITGTLGRSSRVVNSGSFQVVHNLAGFTALYQPNNLTYNNTCCHPIAGSLAVTYSGSISGSGSITFNGCGSATILRNGQSQDVQLNYCE